jgi:hypothetical protein
MTLSNFDWTDKTSVKWFILLPTGHEGPYSLEQLIILRDKKKFAGDVKVWAEGLPEGVTLKSALSPKTVVEKEEIPDLPPIPEEDIPPIPFPEEVVPPTPTPIVQTEQAKKPFLFPVWGFISIVLLLMFFFSFGSIVRNQEKFEVRRLPKMTLALHERIMQENKFDGWDKKIFFKEYLPDDHGHIWLVTSSFHKCSVEATFSSIKEKLLAVQDEKILFKTKGELEGHIVEFSKFEFLNGNKIVPGLYEMDVRATDCAWDGLAPKVMNKFSAPDNEYLGRQKVVLFSKGAVEFNTILDRLIKKKIEIDRKEQSQNELFWQDLQQKLETLNAIALNIESHFLDFLNDGPADFNQNLKPMVDKYTRQFGSFLTSFVVDNENYFKNLNSEAKGASQKRNYELMVRMATKRIGLESMKFIEEFQQKKKPSKKDMDSYTERVKKTFSAIKTDLNGKIIQVSEDRSK